MARTGLTAGFVATVRKPGKYHDKKGLGLFIQVYPSGARCWQQRLTINGRRRTLGLGGYPTVTLKMARDAALENKRMVQAGVDPLAQKRRAPVPTFAEAAATVLELHRPTWSDAREAKNWKRSLEVYVFPRIGSRSVADIEPRDVLEVLMPIWNTKISTAQKVRFRVGKIMKWAIAEGHRKDNPAGEAISDVLPRQEGQRHHRAVHHSQVAGVIALVHRSDAQPVTKLLFEFLVLTAVRSLEARGARWSEFDFTSAMWTVPRERMKAREEHRVPLCARALAILEEVREFGAGSEVVFPGERSRRPLSDSTLSSLLRELRVPAVPHGFRSSFRDWCGESGIAREIAERCLAHAVGSKVEAAYARSDLFKRRRTVMEEWARYLNADPEVSAQDPSRRRS